MLLAASRLSLRAFLAPTTATLGPVSSTGFAPLIYSTAGGSEIFLSSLGYCSHSGVTTCQPSFTAYSSLAMASSTVHNASDSLWTSDT